MLRGFDYENFRACGAEPSYRFTDLFFTRNYLPSSLNRTCSHHEIAADRKTAFASRANEIGMAVVLGLSNAAKPLPNTKCQI
jgi:hypothetical protein